jgi:hypothetical protein
VAFYSKKISLVAARHREDMEILHRLWVAQY